MPDFSGVANIFTQIMSLDSHYMFKKILFYLVMYKCHENKKDYIFPRWATIMNSNNARGIVYPGIGLKKLY